MAAKLVLLVGAVLSIALASAVAQEPAASRPACSANAPHSCPRQVEGATSARQPTTQTKHPDSNTSNLSQTKDGGPPQAVDEKKKVSPTAKAPVIPKAIAPGTKAEDERVIESMDFLLVLEILRDYNLLSDR